MPWLRLLTFAGAGVLALAAPVLAQDLANQPHVRPDAQLLRVIEKATDRSPSFRDAIAQLQALDVTVYVRIQLRMPPGLEGRTALLSVIRGHRYLVIDLAPSRAAITQMSTLGHELFHALEIATERSIIDARSLAAHYTRIGEDLGEINGKKTFETQAAAAAGARVRSELLTFSAARDGAAKSRADSAMIVHEHQ